LDELVAISDTLSPSKSWTVPGRNQLSAAAGGLVLVLDGAGVLEHRDAGVAVDRDLGLGVAVEVGDLGEAEVEAGVLVVDGAVVVVGVGAETTSRSPSPSRSAATVVKLSVEAEVGQGDDRLAEVVDDQACPC
jgi:hypothetical protein